MSDTDSTDTTTTTEDPTQAEHLADLQAENEVLRGQVKTLQAVNEDADTRDERLAAAEQEHAALVKQAGDAILKGALSSAAETLDIDPKLVMGLYAHHFKAVPEQGGTFKIEPNPTEWLATKAKTDTLLRRSVEDVQTKKVAGNVMASLASGDITALADDQVVALVDVLLANPEKKMEFFQRHDGETYLKLTSRASRIRARARS